MIGIILGSFAGAAADRSLVKKSLGGRSYCPKCRHQLAWYDLFPVVSYILLRGKCRYCRKKISLSYPLTEVLTGGLTAYLFIRTFSGFGLPSNFYDLKFINFILDLLIKIFFITVLVILFLTDIKKMLIPDRIILPSIVGGILALAGLSIFKAGWLYYYLSQNQIGRYLLPPRSDYYQRHALASSEPLFFGISTGLAIAGFFYVLIIITKGKGMGGGDVKLGAFIGLMLGFPNAVLALILSFLTGAVFSVGLIVSGKKHFGEIIPFGPFLVFGSLIALFWGNQIIDWYLHFGS